MALSVFMSGLPGSMARAVAEQAVLASDLDLAHLALSFETGSDELLGREVELLGLGDRDLFRSELLKTEEGIVVDYTHPDAVMGNVEFFTQHRMPFVLGTTGGDYEAIEKMVVDSGTLAVVAPNMALPIVAITAMLEWATNQFPGVFDDYQLDVKESHQQGKADTSGTAKDLIARFEKLGADFSADQLELCRDPKLQSDDWGIPDEHLAGHAFHTYDLRSSDKTAHFSLSHNILGRTIYARGTLDAVRFLSQRRGQEVKRSFNMIDVLQNLKGR
jgi:4-hydroxy-tetrahydrodipicolinate reductase